MTQLRLLDFGAPRKSQYINEHFVGIVPTKRVYRGYSVEANGPADLDLNINLGGAVSSVLLTEEGVRVEESGDLSNAVTIAPHATLDRIDYVVAEHQFTNLNNPQTYAVIEGTAGAPPSPPASVPQYNVLLATVYVPAAATQITDDLINQSHDVNTETVIDRSGFLELRPDPQDGINNTVFINGGTYVVSSGLDVITVADGTGDALTFPVVTAPARERYDLLTLDDAGVAARVAGVEAATGLAVSPAYPTDKQVIAEIYVDENVDVRIVESDIRDVRFFFNLGGGAGPGSTTGSTYVNGVSSSTWNINHGLGSANVHVQIYDTSNLFLLPDSITVVDANNVTVTFGSNQDGRAVIIAVA